MFKYPEKFDCIVVGGGHAGCEGALGASRMGMKTLLLTMNIDTVGFMSCNPAVGGLGKGQLVKEIDALGGEMGKAVDSTAIQFRLLNTSMGPAVRSSRAQVDRQMYRSYMKSAVLSQENLHVKQALVEDIIVSDGSVSGVKTAAEEIYTAETVVICPGTFLKGLIHIGMVNFPGGRMGDGSSEKLANSLENLGFGLGRFKTGTCPRIDGRTIDFSNLKIQRGDDAPAPFSFRTGTWKRKQIPCYITFTNPATHGIIRDNLDRSPLYGGVIKSAGVRYCPSIEDKVVKFPQRETHHVFLEPEGLGTCEFYPNGLSTSLPVEAQFAMLRSIPGLEKSEISRPGYGIEHCFVDPTQLNPSLETKLFKGLFLAGQINGTTGYEEAASQGLLAGINAALAVKGREMLVLDRSTSYMGVLIDDLVTRGTDEPYRMFTSRAEYRLLLREDNAPLRLGETGYKIGLVKKSVHRKIVRIKTGLENELKSLEEAVVYPDRETNSKLERMGTSPVKKPATLSEILSRPGVSYSDLVLLDETKTRTMPEIAHQAEISLKYRGYIERQKKEVGKFKQMENMLIPGDFDYKKLPSISNEAREKLSKIKPLSLGQASRIPGITPAAISVLMVYLRRIKNKQ